MEASARLWYAACIFLPFKHLLTPFTGLTETCTVVCSSVDDDIWFGSSGSLLPSFEARIISAEGREITGYDQAGELVVRSPSVALGYLNNDAANKETFQDGWMRTGDEVLVKKSPRGTEHFWIVDRIKELIKVKVGHCDPQSGLRSNKVFLGLSSRTCRARRSSVDSLCCC